MNVFVIPSWYPSASNPIYGTFVKEQLLLMAAHDSTLHFGVSRWGQGDNPFLLYASDPLGSFRKRLTSHKSWQSEESANHHTYFAPAYIWTRRWRKGNLKGLVAANRSNFERFQEEYGMINLIHVQASWPGAWIAAELSYEFKIPYLVTLRMSPFPFVQFLTKEGALDPQLKTVLEGAKVLIATSNSLKERAESFGLPKVVVVNNPVDCELFKPSEADEKQDKDQVRLLGVGRLEEQKGFDVLIRAMAQLSYQYKLEIVGEGSQRVNLEKQIAALGLETRVKLAGELSRDEVAKKMQACNLYVLSSRHETFGNVLLEAMACSKPVIATRCGGPEDIVNQATGIFCEVESVESLVQAIQEASSRKWDNQSIRNHVNEHFSPERFTTTMKAIYERVARSSS